jgi:hypothetical protein
MLTVLGAGFLYFTLYLGMLQTSEVIFSSTHVRMSYYRINGEGIKTFFAPALWIDRHLRPGYWIYAEPFPGTPIEQ